MSEPAQQQAPPRRGIVIAVVVLVGAVLDLFCLLLLPLRVAGHQAPLAPLLVLAVNALLGTAANRLAADQLPAQVLLGVAILVSAAAATRGPGGDVLVTADLQVLYLLFVLAACIGAGVPLLRRRKD